MNDDLPNTHNQSIPRHDDENDNVPSDDITKHMMEEEFATDIDFVIPSISPAFDPNAEGYDREVDRTEATSADDLFAEAKEDNFFDSVNMTGADPLEDEGFGDLLLRFRLYKPYGNDLQQYTVANISKAHMESKKKSLSQQQQQQKKNSKQPATNGTTTDTTNPKGENKFPHGTQFLPRVTLPDFQSINDTALSVMHDAKLLEDPKFIRDTPATKQPTYDLKRDISSNLTLLDKKTQDSMQQLVKAKLTHLTMTQYNQKNNGAPQ